ncbi:MAG TPA: serine hydrolase domain-containing protein [Verrucomicrobiae bacterium]
MPTDKVDDFITAQIHERQIAGLSLAIIQDGKIIKEQGYGFGDKSGKSPITPTTLFQAGSVSKSLTAFGVLRLVEKGQLSLDADVNTHLRAWKMPENEFTKDSKVTLRGILTHSAGLTVHGFPGYAVGSPVPTLLEVLDGVKPANTPPIRVDTIPGSQSRYSGGGYTVMQQMIIDVTGKSFQKFMRDHVLQPLGMIHSTYEQPLPPEMAGSTTTGYDAGGKMILGRHHVYPEMAAAGLWTTAADLARFAIGIQQSFAGDSNSLLSQSMARLMLTNHKNNYGFGVIVEGSKKKLRFYHGGRNRGFDAFLMAYANTGNGVVILINANDDSGMFKDFFKTIAKEYRWP